MCDNWTSDQQKIYSGLKDIGGEAAGYFKSALSYYYGNSLPNRVSHLAHDAREIDGGLRDILSPKEAKKKIEDSFVKKGINKLFGLDLKTHKGHIASILNALDVDEKNKLASEWSNVAVKFAKYAHRHGLWKESRDFNEFKPLWDSYENVLLKLVGSFYAMIRRIDRLMSLDIIDNAAKGAILNLIKIKPYSNYFFRNSDNLKWFEMLNSSDVFLPKNTKLENQIFYLWDIFQYLERLSNQNQFCLKYGTDLLQIINKLVKHSRNVEKISNSYIWWYCVKILNNIPNNLIVECLVCKKDSPNIDFREWLSEWISKDSNSDLTISDISEEVLAQLEDV